MVQFLTEDEAEAYLLELLRKHGKMTTRMVDETIQDHELQCPDGSLKHLNRLRIKGLIKGEVSREHHGWVWWVVDEEENSGNKSES